MICRFGLAALVVALLATSTHATTFVFSYTFAGSFPGVPDFAGETISGTLDGDLQPDGESVAVNRILTASYSGDPGLVFDLTPPDPGTQFTSLSGENTFFGSSNGAEPPDFVIGWLLVQAAVIGEDGNFVAFESFDRSRFSLTVPEPSLLILLPGVLLLALGRPLSLQALWK